MKKALLNGLNSREGEPKHETSPNTLENKTCSTRRATENSGSTELRDMDYPPNNETHEDTQEQHIPGRECSKEHLTVGELTTLLRRWALDWSVWLAGPEFESHERIGCWGACVMIRASPIGAGINVYNFPFLLPITTWADVELMTFIHINVWYSFHWHLRYW